jgi:hypothetical protein
MSYCLSIAKAHVAAHGYAMHAESYLGRERIEPRSCQRIAGVGAYDCDLVAGARLRGREVTDVAEQSADGCTEAVEDAKPCLHTGPSHVLVCARLVRSKLEFGRPGIVQGSCRDRAPTADQNQRSLTCTVSPGSRT